MNCPASSAPLLPRVELDLLPLELLVMIADYCPLIAKIRLSSTSKKLNNAVKLSLKNSEVDISYTRINDDQLKLFSEAKSINLEGCNNIGGEGFGHLSKVKKIIARYNFEDIDLWYFRNAREICLGFCSFITDDGLEHLSNVEVIDLRFLRITDIGLSYLKNVRKIDLSVCERITDTGISSLTKLEYLKIKRNENITNKGLTNLRNLRKIFITDCPNVNGDILIYLEKLEIISIFNLRYFHKFYGFCYYPPSRLQDSSLYATPLPNLREISLYDCGWMNAKLLNKFSNAEKIILTKIQGIGDGEIRLISTFKNIKYLRIDLCRNITDEAVRCFENDKIRRWKIERTKTSFIVELEG